MADIITAGADVTRDGMTMTEETITVKLTRPISHGDKTWSELTFREANLGDMIAADAVTGETARIAAILASISEVPYPAMKKLRAADLVKIMGAAGHFLGNETSTEQTGD